jgi:succinate-acetate transporter protein
VLYITVTASIRIVSFVLLVCALCVPWILIVMLLIQRNSLSEENQFIGRYLRLVVVFSRMLFPSPAHTCSQLRVTIIHLLTVLADQMWPMSRRLCAVPCST